MDRRQVLKNLGRGAGFLVVGPSTLSLLQSCVNEPQYDWKPSFLSAGDGFALTEILDIIIPTTDTPGARDLNLAHFIDSYMHQIVPKERKEEFNRGAVAFSRAFEREFDKEVGEGTKEEYEAIVAKYLKATPEEQELFIKRNTETQDPMDQDPKEDLNPDGDAFSYLKNVRDLGIWSWKTSEEIGENVLWYDPIPGEYIPCAPVEELGNGRAMSL